jgi:uncharacterized protein (DUF169 family)
MTKVNDTIKLQISTLVGRDLDIKDRKANERQRSRHCEAYQKSKIIGRGFHRLSKGITG